MYTGVGDWGWGVGGDETNITGDLYVMVLACIF